MRMIAICLALVAASPAMAQPNGPPPTLKIVTSVDMKKGMLFFKEVAYKPVTVTREREVDMNGVKVKQQYTEVSMIPEERVMTIDVSKSRVITTDGKQLPIDEVWKRVKANTVVAVSGGFNTPSEGFLRALNTEVLVVIPPAPTPVPVPVPMPVPPSEKKG